MADFESLEKLVLQLHESTIREISGLGGEIGGLRGELGELRTEMRDGFVRLESAIRTHRGMLITGTAAYTTLTKAVTELQERETVREAEIRELRDRLRKLEQRGAA